MIIISIIISMISTFLFYPHYLVDNGNGTKNYVSSRRWDYTGYRSMYIES